MKLNSLRARLTLIILSPLLVISLIAAAWQFRNTTSRAENIYDRGLLSAALSISRDVALSEGDALSPSTRRLVNDTSGGELFYHVFAPDGVFVTGYSTPPVFQQATLEDLAEPFYYNGRYKGQNVRVLRFQDVTVVTGVAGIFNITVWQNADVRRNFVYDVLSRSFAVIAVLMLSVAIVVWFGVNLGLRPLLDLERAIAKRNPSELDPIKLQIPTEAQGLVTTLNTLLNRISRRISSKDEFISNAAHQLRNPVAGVLALAESVQNAPNAKTAKLRSIELVQAAREASDLTNKLLSFERASGSDILRSGLTIELKTLIQQTVSAFKFQNQDSDIEVLHILPENEVLIHGDPVMLQEAIINVLANAVVHGGPLLSKITMHLSNDRQNAILIIIDDGVGIPSDKHIEAISRFSQAGGGPGSGLGLPIAARVFDNHRGTLEIRNCSTGASIRLSLPLANLH